MNNLIGLLFLFFLINSCNSIPDKIIPNWRVGDTKLIHYTHEGIVSINDSVVNINVEKKHLVRVIEETNDFYILEFTNKMTLNVDFLANGDTIINDEMKFYELLSK